MENGVRYDEFWQLTPISLNEVIAANIKRQKDEMMTKDILNWQLGQYIKIAYSDIVSAFGKHPVNNYPKEPIFSYKMCKEDKNIEDEQDVSELKELQLMKVMSYLENGNKKIKKKEGK